MGEADDPIVAVVVTFRWSSLKVDQRHRCIPQKQDLSPAGRLAIWRFNTQLST